jgi:C4-dicarboxylate transporter, DctM subunit
VNPEGVIPGVAGAAPAGVRPRWLRGLCQAENLLVVGMLGLMVLLPCLEITLRRFFHTGLAGSAPVVQHLVLMVSMFGGALAARENRLLGISTLGRYLKGSWRSVAQWVAHSLAAAISIFLCLASVPVVVEEYGGGRTVAWGVPNWVIELSLVWGYGLVGLRLLWHAGRGWRWRVAAVGLAGVVVALVLSQAIEPAQLRWPGLILLGVATVLGAPVFTAIGGIALIFLWTGGEPVASVPQNHYTLSVNPTLPSIPLFTLAGFFLAEGGAARRFVQVFQALFGSLRGGPAVVTVLVCAFFTSFTGASGVTILALGGLLMPILLAAGYSYQTALGLLTASGSLGLLFPPCLPPILYSIVASGNPASQVRIEQIFQGGFLPGILLVGMTAAWGVWKAPASTSARPRFELGVAWRAVRGAFWELLLPVVALGALFSGLATPVEAAALTAAYAFVVETFIYRDLKLARDVPRVMTECGLLIGGVLLILGVALGLTHFLILEQVPDLAAEWVTSTIHSPLLFLLVLNVLLIAVGCLMDIYSAIVVVVPILVPIATAFGIDPVHLGVIFLANLELGYLTPPVGMNLFIASYRFNKPMPEVMRSVLPLLGILAVGVLLITYLPPLTLWLPSLFR